MTCGLFVTLTAERAIRGLAAKFPVETREDIFKHLLMLAGNPSLGQVITRGPLKGRRAYPFRIIRSPQVIVLTAFFEMSDDGNTLTITYISEGDAVKKPAKAAGA